MRLVAIVLLIFTSLLFAETQESVYYRAMKAEEAGDVSAALAAFEEAVQIPGPYTEEIREIIDSYYKALGPTTEKKIPWSLRFLGDIGFYGKSGFTFARDKGIRYHGLPEGADSSFFLVNELIDGFLNNITGEYSTPQVYFVSEKDAEEYNEILAE